MRLYTETNICFETQLVIFKVGNFIYVAGLLKKRKTDLRNYEAVRSFFHSCHCLKSWVITLQGTPLGRSQLSHLWDAMKTAIYI